MTTRFALIVFIFILAACNNAPVGEAELVLTNGFVYSLSWGDPAGDGMPAIDAPFEDGIWYPDGEAIYISGDRIMYVGTNEDALAQARENVQVIDLHGATVIPGAIESHGHVHELGEHHEQLDLLDINDRSEIIDMVVERAASVPAGEWIIGWGWDEGAWANDLPNWDALNERVPDHPVVLKGRRGFGAWANKRAILAAGFANDSDNPDGGELVRDSNGDLTGVLLNNAVDALYDAIPEQTLDQRKRILLFGLNEMAASGYVAAHHAGVRSDYMPAYDALAGSGELPIRTHLMLAVVADNRDLTDIYLASGPTTDLSAFLQVRGIKAYYDGSLGSRGAQLLADYADMPGSRGVSGSEYGFDTQVVEDLIAAGFQAGVHAIGDAGNRAVLDFYEDLYSRHPEARALNHRIEHAQVVHPDDFKRFAELNVAASMEPGHAVEDSPWAEDRLGAERVKGAYAWRTMRENGITVIFNSDYSGTDHSLFYGLFAAMTRKSAGGQPPGGWYPEQAMTPEEALRAYTVWPASVSGILEQTGTIEAGKWADLTILSIDPLNIDFSGDIGGGVVSGGIGISPSELLEGEIVMTIVAGKIVYQR